MTRLGVAINDYGTPIVKYRCDACGDVFTVCPEPLQSQDDEWTGCMAPHCSSYDPARNADKLFDDGNVVSFARRKEGAAVRRRPIKETDRG